jgi:hypothetical protein
LIQAGAALVPHPRKYPKDVHLADGLEKARIRQQRAKSERAGRFV